MKKIISVIIMCAIAATMTACKSNETSEPAETTKPMYVQEDGYQTTEKTEANEPAESTTAPTDSKPDKPKTEGNEFNIDGVYNTTVEPNISDDITFEIIVEYTKADGTPVSETITLDGDTSYADIAVNLPAFGLTPTADVLDDTIDAEMWKEHYIGEEIPLFSFFGIGHNPSDVTDAEAALYIEAVSETGIVNDAAALEKREVSVKAIGSKLVTSSASVDYDTMCLYQEIPVKVTYRVIKPDATVDVFVGMLFGMESDIGDYSLMALNHYAVYKNTDYTLVVKKDDVYDNYIGSIYLIKN